MFSVWLLTLVFAASVPHLLVAEPVTVRYPQGTTHGFLILRDDAGKTIALGDLTETIHGRRVASHLLFRFLDGSVDEEKAVFTQSHSFLLESDHHVQRGPAFPKPLDLAIDVPKGNVTLRDTTEGKPVQVTTKHMDLPPDLANGMIMTLITNIRPSVQKTVLPMLVAYNGVRLIHLEITPSGTVPFRVGGNPRAAQQFSVKVDLGGLTGAVAPIVGKQPKDLHFLLLEGEAPAFVRESGEFFEGGPVWRIDQIGPVTQKE